MRKKASMMQPTNFTDFNPLDVLAAAASLQRRTEESDDGENDSHKTGSGASAEEEEDAQDGAEDEDGGAAEKTVNCEDTSVSNPPPEEQAADECDSNEPVVPDHAPNGGTEDGSPEHEQAEVVGVADFSHGAVESLASSDKEKTPTITTCDSSKTVSITPPPSYRAVGAAVSTGRPQLTDHSYAFVSQLQSLKAEEDEGYSSRSSLDDDNEETISRLNHKNSQFQTICGGRAGSTLTGHVTKAAAADHKLQQEDSEHPSNDTSRKATKIVILSKDSKLQRIISGINVGGDDSQLTGSSSGSSLMLRTLLGQKAGLKVSAQGQSKVIIAGGLSGRVINVLKSGSISLAPPDGSRPETATPSEGTLSSKSDQDVPTVNGDEEEGFIASNTSSSAEHVIDDSTVTDSATELTGEGLVDIEQQSVGGSAGNSGCESSSMKGGCETAAPDNQEEPLPSPVAGDGQKPRTLSEVSSRHGSEVVTEDETSCDSSKGGITVDTTPVMSPNVDLTSPLMSPVCERDVPMMSPMVGSPEIMCDIFKLPSFVKHKQRVDSPIPRGECNLTVSCVISEDTVNVCTDPAVVTTVAADGPAADVTDEQPLTVSPSGLDTVEASSQQQNPVQDSVSEGALITNCDSPPRTPTQVESPPQQGDLAQPDLSSEETPSGVEDAQGSPGSLPMEVPPSVGAEDHEAAEQPETDYDNNGGEGLCDGREPDDEICVQKAGITDPALSARNQYIIEDDESPVAKFGTPRSSNDEEAPGVDCGSPVGLAMTPSTGLPSVQSANISQQSEPLMEGSASQVQVPVSGTEPVKVIMTTEASSKSVFTAVRRPLVSGMKALPGSLHMVPVVPTSKSGVMHVVPVGGARGVVTQIIPKTGGQFLTGVPVLSSKTVVLPDNSKGRMNTILVPVSVASNGAAPISIVQTSKAKLANLQQTAVKTEPEAVASSPKLQRRELSSPLAFHGRITPVSTTSDTSPESSLQGGFSGVIMGGRKTPDTLDTTRPSRRTSLENSKDKISIKISSNSVIESDDSMSSDPGFSSSKKETIGIGMMGSLSWKNVESSSPRGLTPIGVGGSGGREFVRIQGGELRTGIPVSDDDSMPPLEKPPKRTARVAKTDGKAGNVYNRKRNKLLTADSSPAPPPPPVSEQYAPQVAQLHPLIDHDYCMFTDFNAQIQSSIIATTESKTKVEKKYAKKTKAVRTKAVRGLITEESLKGVTKGCVEKVINKGRRGRLKKRRTSKEKVTTDEELSLDGTEELDEASMSAVEEKPRKVLEQKPSRTSERRAKLQALKDDKNYVKITGSYQDEFVYFATKNKRNRPRKSLEDHNSQLTKQPQVGGMTVFDWYKDLSKADKTSRFGTPTTSCPSSPVPGFVTHIETDVKSRIKTAATTQETLQPTPTTTTSTPLTRNLNSTFRPGTAPIHESEVADLVCDLSEINSLGTTENTVAPVNDMDLSSFIIGGQDIKSQGTPTPSPSTDPASPASVITPASMDRMAEMAEQVREMLNSMGADELEKLENLELKLGDVDPAAAGMTDTSFDGLLGGFTQEEVAPPITTPTVTNNLCDLDEINDSDLLQSDFGILSDVKPSIPATNTLKPSASAPSLLLEGQGERIPVSDSSSFGLSKTLEFADVKLDKTELFPDMAPPPPPPPAADVSTLAANTAPELTLVSMYWNDLPGLVLMGQQYVRLVDIHKQVLPAKDTGILKKRCQMMGLPIANCSELQRDFLVRYANAAKSKSTVIVSKEAAQTLIGFYVEPKSRPSRQSVEERGIALAQQARAQAAAAAARAATAQQGGTEVSKAVTGSQALTNKPPVLKVASSEASNIKRPFCGKKVKEKGGPAIRRKRRLTAGALSNGGAVPDMSAGDVKRSARLRHKNVSYSDMLLGNHYDNQERKDDCASMAISERQGVLVTLQEPCLSDVSQGNKEIERKLFPEEIEIKKLKIKMRLKSLNTKEKRRLRRLREKVRKREMKRKLRERRKLDRMNGRKKASAMAAALANIVKTKKKLQETHMFNKKYNQEHCYAAAPISPDKKETIQLDDVKRDISEKQVKSPTGAPSGSAMPLTPSVKEEADTDADIEVTCTVPEVLEKTETPHITSHGDGLEVGATEKSKVVKPSPQQVQQKRPPVAVLHRDAVQRLSQRSRWQDGQLYLDKFTDRQASCIRCTTCGEFFSVKRFLKHMHHQNNRDELAHVTLTQTLELRAADAATAEERAIWAEFEARQEELVGPVTPRRPRPAIKSSTPRAKVSDVKAKSPIVSKSQKSPVKPVVKAVAAKIVVNNRNIVGAQSAHSSNKAMFTATPPKTQTCTPPSLVTSPSPMEGVVVAGKTSPKTNTPSSAGRRERATLGVAKKRTIGATRSPNPETTIPSPLRVRGETPTLIRHSTRVRKQKQLHPIEKYVFSSAVTPPPSTVSPAGGETPAKRARLSGADRDLSPLCGAGRGVLTSPSSSSSSSTTPVRKVRLRLSTGGTTAKYDLRAPPEPARQ